MEREKYKIILFIYIFFSYIELEYVPNLFILSDTFILISWKIDNSYYPLSSYLFLKASISLSLNFNKFSVFLLNFFRVFRN